MPDLDAKLFMSQILISCVICERQDNILWLEVWDSQSIIYFLHMPFVSVIEGIEGHTYILCCSQNNNNILHVWAWNYIFFKKNLQSHRGNSAVIETEVRTAVSSDFFIFFIFYNSTDVMQSVADLCLPFGQIFQGGRASSENSKMYYQY